MRELIRDSFVSRLGNDKLNIGYDSAVLPWSGNVAFTTDTFTVKPIFFNGGDIGKLAVAGTVNDLLVTGATPKYLSLAAVIEEGFLFDDLNRIIDSIAATSREAGVSVVTGDTKVVPKGEADGIFLTTTGIGTIDTPIAERVRPGDAVIITGDIGRHGAAILLAREGHRFASSLASDVAVLSPLFAALEPYRASLRIAHDPTRGGLAQTLHEIIDASGVGIELDEVPVSDAVKSVCEIFGFDALFLACEGRAVMIADAAAADNIVTALRHCPDGANAAVIGHVTAGDRLLLNTGYGVQRQIEQLVDTPLPRIC